VVNSTTRRIAFETHQRASDAIVNGEIEGAEFIVWWERLAGLNQGMQGPQTWKRLKEITEMVGGTAEASLEEVDPRAYES
jgi:hypothetical protein